MAGILAIMRFVGLVTVEAAGLALLTGLLIAATEGWNAVRHPFSLSECDDSSERLKDDLMHLVFIVALAVLPLSLLVLIALAIAQAL